MAITDILLRTVSHADLTTKNAVITWEEEDQNFIEIYEALKALQNVDVSLFEPYNAGTTYESGDYVSYDGNIYRFINVTPTAGITPGTDPLYWELASVGEFAHQQNYDQYLDFGGPNQVSAADLYALLNGGTSDFFENGGNSFGATATIGTNDAADFLFKTNNTNRGGITSAGKWMLGLTTPITDTFLSVKSQGATSATFAVKEQNSSASLLRWLRDDGATGQLKAWAQIGETSGEASVLITDEAATILSGPSRKLKFTGSTFGVGAAELTFTSNIIEFDTLVSTFSSTEGIVKLPSQTALNPYGLGGTVKGSLTFQDNDLWLYGFNVYGNIGYEEAEWAKVIIETEKGLVFGEPSVAADVGSGKRVFSIKNAVTEPTAAKADGALLWASSQVLKTNARFNVVKTTEQLRLGYDGSNYFSATVASNGAVTFELTGTGPGFTFNKFLVVNGTLTTASNTAQANFNSASTGANAQTQAELLFAGATTVRARVTSRGVTQTTAGVGESYASWIFGTQGFTEAASGTHALAAQAVFKAITITAGAATTNDSATVYIEGAATGATNNYALWVDAGISRFDGSFNLADAVDFNLGTTTGTKIGTATTQKIGLWNATPIVQPTTAVASATFVANTSAIANDTATFDGYTIGQVVKALRNIGILA